MQIYLVLVKTVSLSKKKNTSFTSLGKPSKKKNGQIWELFPIGWVGLHPVPNFLTGFKKHSECSETHNKHLKKKFFLGGVGLTLRKFISSSLYIFVSEMTFWKFF